jgi:hypothetical protein
MENKDRSQAASQWKTTTCERMNETARQKLLLPGALLVTIQAQLLAPFMLVDLGLAAFFNWTHKFCLLTMTTRCDLVTALPLWLPKRIPAHPAWFDFNWRIKNFHQPRLIPVNVLVCRWS